MKTVYFDLSPLYRGHSGIGRYAREVGARLLEDPSLNVIPVANPGDLSTNPFTRLAFRDMFWWRLLGAQGDGLYVFPHAAVAPGFLKKHPSIITIHDIAAWHDRGTTTFIGARNARNLPTATRYAKAIVTVSEYSAKDISATFGIDRSKITVLPNGVSEPFRSAPRTDGPPARFAEPLGGKPFLLHVGNWEPKKNVVFLIDRFRAAVREAGVDARLVLTGSAAWRNKGRILEAIAGDPRIVVTGPLADEELLGLYDHAAAAALPSLAEGFGLPVVEGLCRGTPVLVSDRTSLPEFAPYGAEVLSLEEPERWKRAIAEKLTRGWEPGNPIPGAGKVKEAFDWDKTAIRMTELLRAFAE